MRDYRYVGDGGPLMVAQLPTTLIHELLRDGFQISDEDGIVDPYRCVRERLELELFIRERGLRAG